MAQTITTKEPALTINDCAAETTGVVDFEALDPATGAADGIAAGAATGTATGAAMTGALTGAVTGVVTGGPTGGAGRTVSQRFPMKRTLSQRHISPFQEPRLLHQERSYWKYAISETR
jgi:hypothetical protein